MSLPISVEMAKAMLEQERLQQIAIRAQADEKIRLIDAQLGGMALTLEVQARAAEAAQAEVPPATAPDAETPPA